MIRLVVSETDYDETQQWAAKDTTTEKSLGGQCACGVCEQCDSLLAPEVQKEPKGAQGSPVTPRRQIPASHSTWAKPLLSDYRHSIFNCETGAETTVFAPAGVPEDDIIKALKTPTDWRYVRPTSHRYDKWVYYPLENAE